MSELRIFDAEIRRKSHEQPMEKKKKSLAAKSFILFPFELLEKEKGSLEEKERESSSSLPEWNLPLPKVEFADAQSGRCCSKSDIYYCQRVMRKETE